MKIANPLRCLALLTTALGLLVSGCAGDDEPAVADQVIAINWGSEPLSLEPGLAIDTTSANILLNIMDPLVKLDDDLEPIANAATSWAVSADGETVTFRLRNDLKWTNGDRVTAADFEWSWKRTMSPQLDADYAFQFFGIRGASEYHECTRNCDALRDKVGIEAVDDRTLRVVLASPQPWFVQQVAHHSFVAVHRPTVERFGDKWTEANNIVTNGPFRLARWEHNVRIDLAKWEGWRDADNVMLERVNGRMIGDGERAVQAFAKGALDVNMNVPAATLSRIKKTAAYEQYEGLGTYYYGFNVQNIPDVNQRRAMALAIPRQSIIDNIAQADQIPATGFTPQGMPGFDEINPQSEWLAEAGAMERAKQLMAQVQNPVRNVSLLLNDSPGHREIAAAVQAAWEKLGIKTAIKVQEWEQFLEFLGPPPHRSVDVYRLGWLGDFVDAFNFLELWTCESANNNSNYCNARYDRLVDEARATEDDAGRFRIYGQLEKILFGADGDVPVAPIYWYTYIQQEDASVRKTLERNPLDQIDLTKVRVEA